LKVNTPTLITYYRTSLTDIYIHFETFVHFFAAGFLGPLFLLGAAGLAATGVGVGVTTAGASCTLGGSTLATGAGLISVLGVTA
jgi:hypothetical protein